MQTSQGAFVMEEWTVRWFENWLNGRRLDQVRIVHSFISELDEGVDASSGSSLMTQNWEQWLIPQSAGEGS